MPGRDKSEGPRQESSAATGQPAFSLISTAKLLQIYSTMVKCRVLEERLCLFAPQSETSGVGEAMREASVVGATVDLGRGDAVVPSQWHFLADLANGGLPKMTLTRLVARKGSRGMRPPAPGLRFRSAIREARMRKGKRTRKIVVAFADNGETAAPSWRKLLAIAVRQKLPIVFIVVQTQRPPTGINGQERDAMEPPRRRVAVRGLPAIVVDVDDAVAVYRVAYEAIARARRGLGPTLIECEPYFVETQTVSRAKP
jgi:TPP-dependent pyruvate/acetoin dehydrogenase alpha subunit